MSLPEWNRSEQALHVPVDDLGHETLLDSAELASRNWSTVTCGIGGRATAFRLLRGREGAAPIAEVEPEVRRELGR